MNARMTGAEALLHSLKRWDTDTLFALPGVHLDPLFDALHGRRKEFRILYPRHEQTAGYMAAGYAMASGRPGVFAVVPGPGVLNAGAALAAAYACSAPVLCITTTVFLSRIDKHYGVLHELPDQPGILSRLTKWSARAEHPAQIPELVDEAFRQMLGGRPRPVALEVPPEILAQSAQVHIPADRPQIPALPVDAEAVEAAAELLAGAANPLIVVGGGAQDAAASVQVLAERLQAPVVSRQMGRGVLSSAHPLCIPGAASNDLWKSADVVLGIGTRLSQLWELGVDPALKVIRIDVDAAETRRVEAPAVAILAKAEDAVPALDTALGRRGVQRTSREKELAAMQQAFRSDFERTVAPQVAFLDAIRAALPDDGVFIEEMTQVGYVARFALPIYQPRTYITSGYQGTLGAGYATALGVQAALPERRVLSVNGDGGFLYAATELATAMLHKLPVVALVFNDGRFGNIHTIQKHWYGGRLIATELHNPDFVAFTRSFGALALKARGAGDLADRIGEAFAHGGPAVIEVPMDIDAMGWPWDYLKPKPVR
jgi:acetolactate synthase-1/2/3 large subunit